MEPFSQLAESRKRMIRYVLTDIDDTLTFGGRLVGAAFSAMENLRQAGIRVVPITGRPAGWCDHIARMWPVDALVGENGAFYFRYDSRQKKMIRRYYKSSEERLRDRRNLSQIEKRILSEIPGAAVSADQPYREADLAIDFCEDVPSLSKQQINRIVACFKNAGAQAKISSIHVNGWFGDYDKLAMSRILFAEIFKTELEAVRDAVLFIGDSPNDAPMFAFFPISVGVANVNHFIDDIETPPAWVTEKEGGYGFAEMAAALLH